MSSIKNNNMSVYKLQTVAVFRKRTLSLAARCVRLKVTAPLKSKWALLKLWQSEQGVGGRVRGVVCPLRSDSHVLCRWGRRVKWDRK